MAKNASLNRAFKARQDEFYTRAEDIERELCLYEKHFQGKIVYRNPDGKNFTYKLEAEPDENGPFSIFEDPMLTPLPCNMEG